MEQYSRSEVRILDHGYLRVVEDWGYGDAKIAEAGIIEAARQSTKGSFRGWDRDEKLLNFLHNNKHSSPFEFAGMIIEVQAPIMVFREWHRHRTQSYNEMSGRYVELPDLCYIPSIPRLISGKQSLINKQGSDEGFTAEDAGQLQMEFIEAGLRSRASYTRLINRGVSKELARLILPVNQYSRMRASANLRNWLAFLTLRTAPNAQWEIREYAEALASEMRISFPKTMRLFDGLES